jgi:hypothetical protein
MNFFTWLTTKRKTLATMSVTELRAQEMLLENERNRMQAKLQRLAEQKQKIVDRGAKERTPEMRRTLAQQYDLLHTEQMMIGRHLNIRSKELLTVSRLRMLRENAQRAGLAAGPIVSIREADLATIEKLIESDAVSSEAAAAGVSSAGQEVMRIWEDMDAGLIQGEEAFDEAERRVREREKHKAAE